MLMPTHGGSNLRHVTGEDAARASKNDDDERELATLRQQDRDLGGNRQADTERAARDQQDEALDREQSHDRGEDEDDVGPHRADVDGHSHRDEEQADQEPLERRDVDFDLVAVFGFGQ